MCVSWATISRIPELIGRINNVSIQEIHQNANICLRNSYFTYLQYITELYTPHAPQQPMWTVSNLVLYSTIASPDVNNKKTRVAVVGQLFLCPCKIEHSCKNYLFSKLKILTNHKYKLSLPPRTTSLRKFVSLLCFVCTRIKKRHKYNNKYRMVFLQTWKVIASSAPKTLAQTTPTPQQTQKQQSDAWKAKHSLPCMPPFHWAKI